MSSRAVPVKTMISNIESGPAMPLHWGKNQPGMQASEECNNSIKIDLTWLVEGLVYELPRNLGWEEAMKFAVSVANGYNDAGYHKQIVNRILEPFQTICTVVTATEWDNWYWLRDHADAQPEIKNLAGMMLEQMNDSIPAALGSGDWHTPFYKDGFWIYDRQINNLPVDIYGNTLETALNISASCAAQTSFRKEDDSVEKANSIKSRLIESEPVHASPFEHQATPLTVFNYFDECYSNGVNVKSTVTPFDIMEKNQLMTHVDKKGDFWSSNFRHWGQNRNMIPNNNCVSYSKLEKK